MNGTNKWWLMAALALALAGAGPGCSIKHIAVNKLGDALAGSGGSFASDDDPDLIQAAAPFSLKLMESLLAESPRHERLLTVTASGFAQYAFAFVQQQADELEDKDLAAAEHLRGRARRLYLRSRNYGLRGLDLRHPGFEPALRANPLQAVRQTTSADVELLYWTAAAWGAAISLSKDNPDLIAEQPLVEALIDRALALNERFDHGAIHSFLITYEMSRPGGAGDAPARAKKHFDRALELSGGQLAGPLVSFAEAVCIQKQDRRQFETLLKRALAINPDANPQWRLVNLVMQRRATWLLGRADELFLRPAAPGQAPPQ